MERLPYKALTITLAGVLLVTAVLVAQTALNDAMPNPSDAPQPSSSYLMGYNGGTASTAWTRLKTMSLATMPTSQTFTSSVENGRILVETPARWSKVSTPAVSTQASSSIAAEANVRHVADCISFSAGSTTAPVLTKLNINLRDGATGAGTIIKSWTVVIGAATGQNVVPYMECGLGLTGTTNTAMTLEYSALLTNLFEDVTLTGTNVF